MKAQFLSCFFASVVLTSQLSAQSFVHDASPEETNEAIRINRELRRSGQFKQQTQGIIPVRDDADFGYVLMSATDNGVAEVKTLRQTIASNLPAGVKLVILTRKSSAASVRAQYLQWISADRLIIASDDDASNSNGFWARDSFPIPVWDETTFEASLVSVKYYRTFNSANTIVSSVGAKASAYNQIFVGGNILSDEDGNCFSVNSFRLFDLNKDEIQSFFGCKSVTLLDHVAGLGDVDEVIKPLTNKRMLTSSPTYRSMLEARGYNVFMLPEVPNTYRTYTNSLIVGDTVFMPAYGVATDQTASAVYEGLGFKVIPIRSNYLSDSMHGSIHCQTMAYPVMPQEILFKALGVSEVVN